MAANEPTPYSELNYGPYSGLVHLYRNSLDKIFNNYFPEHKQKNQCEFGGTGKYVIVSSIHKHENLCFNSQHREILYAIQSCFKRGQADCKECALGKALIISFKNVPIEPPFENIMCHYLKHFLDRLELIDIYLSDKKKILDESVNSHLLLIPERVPHLIAEKKTLYKTTFAYNAFYTPIPRDVFSIVSEFLHEADFVKCIKLRQKYEDLRADINTYTMLKPY